MDSMLTAPELARELGVSLPAAHRLMDAHGVPSPGRGRVRRAPRSLLGAALRDRGAVRDTVPGFSASRLRVLAALSRAPWGLRSARHIAERAGVSPTVASRELRELGRLGLVAQRQRVVALDRARVRSEWATDTARWPATLFGAVNRVVLPRPTTRRSRTGPGVPKRFAHLFWNADVGALDTNADASFIAGRMLASSNVDAWNWALSNLPPSDIDRATSRRGVDPATRALVRNWRTNA